MQRQTRNCQLASIAVDGKAEHFFDTQCAP